MLVLQIFVRVLVPVMGVVEVLLVQSGGSSVWLLRFETNPVDCEGRGVGWIRLLPSTGVTSQVGR